VYEHAVSEAKQHGVTPDVARDAVREAGEKLKTVVQKATDTLDEKAAENRSSASS